jgi:hypothetical protein
MKTDADFKWLVVCGAVVLVVIFVGATISGRDTHAEKMACIQAHGYWHDDFCDLRKP